MSCQPARPLLLFLLVFASFLRSRADPFGFAVESWPPSIFFGERITRSTEDACEEEEEEEEPKGIHLCSKIGIGKVWNSLPRYFYPSRARREIQFGR